MLTLNSSPFIVLSSDAPAVDGAAAPRSLRASKAPSASVLALVVDRLYRVAALLEQDWRDAGLADDFASLMILAVLRFLARTGDRRPDGTRRSPAEQADFAEALLRRFWAQNARRDAARRADAVERGASAVCVSQELTGEQETAYHLYDPLKDDLLAGDTGRTVARFLEGLGWPRERAWAFVWRESGREWDDVAFLLAERFEADATPGCLRKWGERYFEPVKPRVRAFLEEHGLTDAPAA